MTSDLGERKSFLVSESFFVLFELLNFDLYELKFIFFKNLGRNFLIFEVFFCLKPILNELILIFESF